MIDREGDEGPVVGGWRCEWCFASEEQYIYELKTALVCGDGLPWSDFAWQKQHVKFLRQTGHWFGISKWKLMNKLTETPGGEEAYRALQLLKQGKHPTAALPRYVVRWQRLPRFRLA